MAGDKLDIYRGEFLTNPCPLEISFNYCSFGCDYCIEESSPVLMGNLLTKAGKDVRVGDVLMGWEAAGSGHRRWVYSIVEEVFGRDVEGVEVELANGKTIRCTPDHHFWTGRSGEIEYAPILTKGRGVLRQSRRLHQVVFDLVPSRPFTDAFMLGYIKAVCEGDASRTPYGAVRLAQKAIEVLERVKAFCLELGCDDPKIRDFKHYKDADKRAPMFQIYFPVGSPVAELCNGPDLEGDDYWAGWLSGIYDAEGCHSQNTLRISQYREINPNTYAKIGAALRRFNFAAVEEWNGWRFNGGIKEQVRFIQITQPVIERNRNPLAGRSIKDTNEAVPVVSVRPCGLIRVASFRTSTHNYVSGGFMSRNCFANLNRPNRKADYKAIMGLLTEYQKRSRLEAEYLKQRSPILCSNRVDAFAPSNYRLAKPILELMTELDLPIAFQTKTGPNVLDALDFLEPAVWYVSVSYWEDEIRGRIERPAPPIAQRLEIIEELVRRECPVVVGINPCIPEWLPLSDAEKLLAKLAELGVWGVWVEPLHLDKYQVDSMPEASKLSMGEGVIKVASKRKQDPVWVEHIHRVLDLAAEVGLETYSSVREQYTQFFAPYYELYEGSIPTWQSIVNLLVEAEVQPNEPILFGDIAPIILEKLPPGDHLNYGDYLGALMSSTERALRRAGQYPSHKMAPERLLQLIWNGEKGRVCPVVLGCFSFACEDRGEELVPYLDEEGNKVLIFNLEGFEYKYTGVELA